MAESVHIVCPHCGGINRLPADKLANGGKCGKCGKCKQALFSGEPITLTVENFARHINRSDIPLLVDFWAPWCGPCKMMAPIFTQAALQLEPQIRLAKVDTEQQQALATQYNIRSIPTLAAFKGGQEVARMAGAMELDKLLTWARQHL